MLRWQPKSIKGCMSDKIKFKKGDQVLITSGKDKGKKAKIDRIFKKKGSVLLPGLNVYKKHMKKKDEKQQGGIIDFSRPVLFSNIALICPKCTKPTRIGWQLSAKDKIRVCRKCHGRL